jgi:hypothetical protein
VFFWQDLAVDDTGVRTLGYYLPADRTPTALIDGPVLITAQLPSHSASASYQLTTQDLRGKLAIQWNIDGAPAGKAATQDVQLRAPGLDPGVVSRRIQVEVRDEDELTAAHELTVSLRVIVPPGKQPF